MRLYIFTVYDAGELEDRQYLVTEFMDGGTLNYPKICFTTFP
jgi:hypothetical protein